jgi:hypothetical protein
VVIDGFGADDELATDLRVGVPRVIVALSREPSDLGLLSGEMESLGRAAALDASPKRSGTVSRDPALHEAVLGPPVDRSTCTLRLSGHIARTKGRRWSGISSAEQPRTVSSLV